MNTTTTTTTSTTQTPMTEEHTQAAILGWRSAYAAGVLPKWMINRIEQIPGWTGTANEGGISSTEVPA